MESPLHLSLKQLAQISSIIARCPAVAIEVDPPYELKAAFPKFENCKGSRTLVEAGFVKITVYSGEDTESVPPILTREEREGLIAVANQVWERVEQSAQTHVKQRVSIQSEKMSALGEMAAGIAHEVNNPLAIIQGNLNKMRTLIENGILDPAILQDSVSVATKTVTRIGKIVNGLRNFARDGERDPFQKVDLYRIVDETLGLCSERFKNHNVKMQIRSIPRDLLIECRSVQISQVLLNLLSNAFDAIESQAERWVDLDYYDGGTYVDIFVTDSGHPILADVQKKMFEPFFTTKPIGKGTGLGLSISRGIIESHHGGLELDQKCPNTRFIVRLPKKQTGVTSILDPQPDVSNSAKDPYK